MAYFKPVVYFSSVDSMMEAMAAKVQAEEDGKWLALLIIQNKTQKILQEVKDEGLILRNRVEHESFEITEDIAHILAEWAFKFDCPWTALIWDEEYSIWKK